MSTKLVTWISTNCLPCSCKGTVNVIMCTIFNKTVPGQIIESSKTSGCETGSWKYQIQYDSDDLPVGVTALATTDISNVACEGCLTTWIRENFQTYSVSEREAGYVVDFSAADDQDQDSGLTLSVTNPSLNQDLVGMVHFSFQCSLSALGAYAAGVQAGLLVDGVVAADTTAAVYFGTSDAGEGTSVMQAHGVACYPLTISPGETVDLTVVFTANISTIPSSSFIVNYGELAFQGSTTIA